MASLSSTHHAASTRLGMDRNRTHPGRLNSAPQTVLKTTGLGVDVADSGLQLLIGRLLGCLTSR